MKRYFELLFLLCMFSLSAKSGQERNVLKDLSYHQGELVDTIICYFEDTPSCIYEPTPTYRRETNKAQATFFLPFVSVAHESPKRVVQQINSAAQEGYTIALEPIVKPVHGLRVHITYDPEKVGWEYGPLDVLDTRKGLIFKMYNKRLLRTIGQTSTPLRWYAQAKHQPRIVVDAASARRSTGHLDNATSLATQITAFLRSNGCEVLMTRNADVEVSAGIRASYANLYAHADVLLSLSDSQAKQHHVFTLSPALLKARQSTLTAQERSRLDTVTKWVHVQSALLETALDKKLKAFTKMQEAPLIEGDTQNRYSEVLLGAEMPALCVQLGAATPKKNRDYYKELAQAIGSGILLYISEKKFLKTLYKKPGRGTLKITDECETVIIV